MISIKSPFSWLLIYAAAIIFLVPIVVLLLAGNASRKNNLSQNSAIPTNPKEKFITAFCNLVDQGKIPEAMAMIDLKDQRREVWETTLSSFSSFKLKSIESLNSDPSQNSFKVEIDAILKENQNPTDWANGVNKKRIDLTETAPQTLKIKEIATEQ